MFYIYIYMIQIYPSEREKDNIHDYFLWLKYHRYGYFYNIIIYCINYSTEENPRRKIGAITRRNRREVSIYRAS